MLICDDQNGNSNEPNYENFERFLLTHEFPPQLKRVKNIGAKSNFIHQANRFVMAKGELTTITRTSKSQKPKNHIPFDTLRGIKDPHKRWSMCAHEGLGSSRWAKALRWPPRGQKWNWEKSLTLDFDGPIWTKKLGNTLATCEQCQKGNTKMSKAMNTYSSQCTCKWTKSGHRLVLTYAVFQKHLRDMLASVHVLRQTIFPNVLKQNLSTAKLLRK